MAEKTKKMSDKHAESLKYFSYLFTLKQHGIWENNNAIDASEFWEESSQEI